MIPHDGDRRRRIRPREVRPRRPDLALVIERPDLYTITCNGRSLTAQPGAWWLDKAFGRLALTGLARLGENVVTLRCSPFSILHELEPAYLIGSFALKAAIWASRALGRK